jgi:opacity protein-like surface antigen
MSDIVKMWVAAVALAVTLGASAGAADLQRPPPQPYPETPVWTGSHVGAHLGYAFAGEEASSGFFGTPVTSSTNPSGVIGGLEAGYDYQFYLLDASTKSAAAPACQHRNPVRVEGRCVGLPQELLAMQFLIRGASGTGANGHK